MDIFISGYGKLEIDSDVLCVRFLYEEKSKFYKKKLFSIWVSNVRTSYEVQNEANQYHSFLQVFVH